MQQVSFQVAAEFDCNPGPLTQWHHSPHSNVTCIVPTTPPSLEPGLSCDALNRISYEAARIWVGDLQLCQSFYDFIQWKLQSSLSKFCKNHDISFFFHISTVLWIVIFLFFIFQLILLFILLSVMLKIYTYNHHPCLYIKQIYACFNSLWPGDAI